MLLLFYFQLTHRRQKALLAAKVALETETKERRILARDLHDGLGGMLSLLRIRSLTPNPSPVGEGLGVRLWNSRSTAVPTSW